MSGIYMIKNKSTNKSYIGQSSNISKRINDHTSSLAAGTHHNKYLQRAWDKYGINDFDIIILEKTDLDELNDKEIYYIAKYKSNNNKYGYNLTDGGEGTVGFKHTEESKKSMSEAKMGKKVSRKTRERMSETKKGKIPKNIKILLQSNEDSKIPILQFDNNGELVAEWDGVNECAGELGVLATNLVKTLKGKQKTCSGFVFLYKKEYKDNKKTKEMIVKRFNSVRGVPKPVVQKSIDGRYITTWGSISEAVKQTGFRRASISDCCTGKIADYRNYKWEFKQ